MQLKMNELKDKAKEIRQNHKIPLIMLGISWKILITLVFLEQRGCINNYDITPQKQELIEVLDCDSIDGQSETIHR